MASASARQFHKIIGEFTMQNGSIKDAIIAYETWGELNFQKDNAVLLFTGLSPSLIKALIAVGAV